MRGILLYQDLAFYTGVWSCVIFQNKKATICCTASVVFTIFELVFNIWLFYKF